MAMVMENQQPVAHAQLVAAAPSPPPPPPPPLPVPRAYKHRCKVCKKGFVCGRALGGHMRAHGVADDGASADDDAMEDDSGQRGGGNTEDSSEAASPSAAATTKPMYALRTNPCRLKSCRVCENCGKEFTSWKSLLDHGRCTDEEEEDDDVDGSIRSPPPPRDADDDGEEGVDLALAAGGWSKGKRTRRAKVMVVGTGSVTEVQSPASPSSEEEDLANCLVMLSSSRCARPPPVAADADQESCASASNKDVERNRVLVPQPISVMAPAMMPELKLLAPPQVVAQPASAVPRGLFECKACKKVFTSHQALGGHRASHKKVKGCFAAKLESDRNVPPQPVTGTPGANTTNADGNPMNSGTSVVVMATAAPAPVMAATEVDEAPAPSSVSPVKKKGKVHECSICHRVFTSGQALGGHKRCHWLTTGSGDPTGALAKLHPIVAQDHVMHAVCQQLTLGRPVFGASDPILDLNMSTNPSPAERAATKQQAAELNGSVLCLNAPASLYMQSWTVHNNASNVNRTATSSRNDAAGAAATEDEADSRSDKRGKISDLRDMDVAGETSPWLQVGIGPSPESKERSARE